MIDAKTQICCIIGHPVAHSLSPQMHSAAYKELGINFRFVAFDVEDVQKAVAGIRALGIRGVAVTIPHKITVMKYVDKIDETAGKIGAVNCLVNDNGVLKATNTDWIGALDALCEITPVLGKRVALIGAGGAARALAFGLKKAKAKVSVFNRTLKKGEILMREFNLDGFYGLTATHKIKEMDILINTTSVGMEPNTDESPIPASSILSRHTVFDIVYTPHETKLLRLAREKSAKRVFGYKMVLYGGVRIFELCTGQKAPLSLMEKTLLSHLTTIHK